MLGESLIALSESALHIAGGIVGFSISRVARQGYRETSSPTLFRLSIAFALLGLGLSLTGITLFIQLSTFEVFTIWLSAALVIATSLETTGYFILALSQGIKARSSRSSKTGLLAIAAVPTLPILAFLRSLSFIFILYAMIETILSYLESKRPYTLGIAIGLGLLAMSVFVKWLALFYTGVSPLLIASILLKLFGFIMLYIPVMRFTSMKGVPQFANI